jgi:hypothetical protein
VKRLSSPWTCAGCGLVLLNVFLFATTAAAQLAVNPSTVNFGSVPIGNSVSKSVALSNTGSSNLTISQATVSGTGFSNNASSLPLTLAPGQGANLTATFTAPQAGGSTSGSLRLAYSVFKARNHRRSSTSTGTATVSLTGTVATPGQLTASASSLNFAPVQVGGSATLTDSLTNTGGASVTISQATVSTVSGAGFSLSSWPNTPFTLSPGARVTFSAVFAPPSPVSASGSISVSSVSSNASNPTLTIISLSGTGTAQGQLILTPAAGFGNVTVGTTATQAGSLSASGASVTVSSANLIGSGEFSLTGISPGLTIAAGQKVPFTVTFAPQTSGGASANLSFSNASNSPVVETLSGTGVAAPQHIVSLSWTDPGSGIVGYHVYRGSVTGGPYAKITSALDTPTAYSDNSVLAGQTYYYVTTAVDGRGTESAYSNEAKAVIPTP